MRGNTVTLKATAAQTGGAVTFTEIEALVATGWSKAAAARRLRVSRQRLYERLAALNERHGVDVDLPQTRVELALEAWAVRMADLVD